MGDVYDSFLCKYVYSHWTQINLHVCVCVYVCVWYPTSVGWLSLKQKDSNACSEVKELLKLQNLISNPCLWVIYILIMSVFSSTWIQWSVRCSAYKNAGVKTYSTFFHLLIMFNRQLHRKHTIVCLLMCKWDLSQWLLQAHKLHLFTPSKLFPMKISFWMNQLDAGFL